MGFNSGFKGLNIPKTVAFWILKNYLGKRKLCARFVPQTLTSEQKDKSSHILPRHYSDDQCRQKLFLNKISRDMKTSVLPMTPEEKVTEL